MGSQFNMPKFVMAKLWCWYGGGGVGMRVMTDCFMVVHVLVFGQLLVFGWFLID